MLALEALGRAALGFVARWKADHLPLTWPPGGGGGAGASSAIEGIEGPRDGDGDGAVAPLAA